MSKPAYSRIGNRLTLWYRWGLIISIITVTVASAQTSNSLKLPDLIIFNPDSSQVQPGKMLDFTPSPVEAIHTPPLEVQSGVILPPPKTILVIPEAYRAASSDMLQELAFRLGYRQWISASYKNIIQRQPYDNQFNLGFEHYKPSTDFGRKLTAFDLTDRFTWSFTPGFYLSVRADYAYSKIPLLPQPKSGDIQIPSQDSMVFDPATSRVLNHFRLNPVLNYTMSRSTHSLGLNFAGRSADYAGIFAPLIVPTDLPSLSFSSQSDWRNTQLQLFHSSRFQLSGGRIIGIENLLDFQRNKISSNRFSQKNSDDFWMYKCVVLYEQFPYSLRLEPGFMSKPGDETFILDFRAAYQWNLPYGIQQQLEVSHQHHTQVERILQDDRQPGVSSLSLMNSPEPYGLFQLAVLTTYRKSNQLVFTMSAGYQLMKNYMAYLYNYSDISWQHDIDFREGYWPEFTYYKLYPADFERLFLNFTASYQATGYIKLQNRMKAYAHFNVDTDEQARYTLESISSSIGNNPDWEFKNRLYGIPAFENEFLCTFYLPFQVHLTGYLVFKSGFKVNPVCRNRDYLSLNAEFKKTIRRNLDAYLTAYNLLNREQYEYYPLLSRDMTLGAGLNWVF
ncbi:MAG: hypothetical protein KBA26_11345 [Candidatus Delongbacteria bacterium]|nr:hypothetical protein [Candidatus Delongbacteria bacterium]